MIIRTKNPLLHHDFWTKLVFFSNYESINLGCTSFLLPLGCSGLTILSRHPITEVHIVLVMMDMMAMLMMLAVVVVVMINNSGATGPVHPPRQLLEIRRRNICPERGRFFCLYCTKDFGTFSKLTLALVWYVWRASSKYLKLSLSGKGSVCVGKHQHCFAFLATKGF